MTAELDTLKAAIADLVEAEIRSIGTDADASEAGAWVKMTAKTEAEADAALDPSIKAAFAAHKKLTGEKKSLLEKLVGAKNRVRLNLANWIAGDHSVEGFYIKKKWTVTVADFDKLPKEYTKVVADQEALDAFATLTEGRVGIDGCTIEQVNTLYSLKDKA